MPPKGGYFVGNISPGKIDEKWFCHGNCIAILSSLANPEQCAAIVDIIECKWTDLITKIPLKICYSAIMGLDQKVITECDPKNIQWSYHNDGTWPGT